MWFFALGVAIPHWLGGMEPLPASDTDLLPRENITVEDLEVDGTSLEETGNCVVLKQRRRPVFAQAPLRNPCHIFFLAGPA